MTDWARLTIAVVAGDEREREIARLAAATGARVRGYGFPWPAQPIPGVDPADSAAQALRDADYALLPIPGIAADGSLFAPAHPEPIVPSAELLRGLSPGASIVLGAADERLRAVATELEIALYEYEDDRELMLLRGPAIVEGAVRTAIDHTEVTIHGSEVAVLGHGTIGALLARTLRALGADVTVAARNPIQRAEAQAAGARAVGLEQLPALAERMAVIFSAVPAPIVGREVLERLAPGSLVMDLAAPPGSIDLELARELGHLGIWARGLGRRAPVTVGASQWGGIRRRIEQHEARKAAI